LTSEDLAKSFSIFSGCKKGSLLSTCEFSFHPLRSFEVRPNNQVTYRWPEYKNSRTQDLPDFSHDAGMFYWMNSADALSEKTMLIEPIIQYQIPPTRVQDIDTFSDWEQAEIKLANFNSRGGQ
jgi:pseudaminic acid cytidylyltransferase